ncbi:hypothetical protein N8766_01575 [bacterium]|jgi:hypothetical protein|nr:hypothetical protein [bacterium]MDA7667754.1 hypothetical protein [bacterium]
MAVLLGGDKSGMGHYFKNICENGEIAHEARVGKMATVLNGKAF